MEKFQEHRGLVAPLDRANVDTDQMMPKQFLKRVERTGFGQFLFYDWRFTPAGEPRPEFVLNEPRYGGASILLAGKNFGCGSSREHAPWALSEYGFRALIAPSFADIFYNNCLLNGLLPVTLPERAVSELMVRARKEPGYQLTVNLETSTVHDEHGFQAAFHMDSFRRYCLLNGLDEIALTLQQGSAIDAYEARRGQRAR